MISKYSKLTTGAFLLAISSILSRVLGLLRDILFSSSFGTGSANSIFSLDAYFAAFRIPDFLYTLLIVGAMSAAFLPLYTGLQKQKGQEEANRFASQIVFLLSIALLIGSTILFLFAPLLSELLAPGFSPQQQELTAQLTRIMLISPIFLGLSSVLQGIENAHERFLGMALAPLFYNMSILCATYFFADEMGVVALAWGVSIGAFLHFLIQIPGIIKTPFRFKFQMPWLKEDLKSFFLLTLPRLAGLSLSQLGLFFDTSLASLLTLGSLSAYQYALNLQSFPYGVVAVSVSVAAFTRLAQLAAPKDHGEFVKLFRDTLGNILFLVLPLIVAIFLLRVEIIEVLLQRGSFTAQDTQVTAGLLGIFIWAALAQSLSPLLARSFYALKNTKTPFFVSLGILILGLCSSVFLIFQLDWGVQALATSMLISQSVGAILLFVLLAKKLQTPLLDLMPKKIPLQICGSILMLGWTSLMRSLLDDSLWILVCSVSGSFTLYLAFSTFTKSLPSRL